MHYKKMFDDKEHLYAFDLDGRDVTVEIEDVRAGEVTGDKGKKSKKPVIKFVGKEKKLAINKTNGKIIASLYGKDTDDWIGQLITIFPTTTEFGGDTVDCIRVRPQRPAQRPRSGGNDRKQDKRTQQSAPPPAAGQSDPAPLTPEEEAEILRQENQHGG